MLYEVGGGGGASMCTLLRCRGKYCSGSRNWGSGTVRGYAAAEQWWALRQELLETQ
jgi:hypothetical protein